ncbi:MAG: hypothetical protein IT369_06045 [Candidatus Latescibacteria bacterium]|nr:hypothetical protein [Candidatus Latescibacterota bacterium]
MERGGEVPGAAGLGWTVHPLREEPWPKSAALGGVVAGVAAVAALSFEGVEYGLLSLGVLLASLSSYFCPTHYQLDEAGVQVRHLGRSRQRPWAQFCRIDRCREGVFLSPFARPSRLDSFRGCLLRSPRDPERVRHFAQRHVGPAAP